MTAEEIKTELNKVFEQPYTSQIYFVLKKDNDFCIKLADIESSKTEPELRALFTSSIRSSILDNDDLTLPLLSAADDRSNALFQYDYDEYPEEIGLFNRFDIKEATATAPKFDFTQDDLASLNGFIVYIGSMDCGIALFKKHYPISLIKRDSFLLGMKKATQRFEKLDGEDIVRLNDDYQMIKIADKLFVKNIKAIEQTMGFNELIFRAAKDAIQTIDGIGIIEDIQVLKDSSDDISFSRKLSKVKSSSPIFKLNIPKEDIIAFTKTAPGLAGIFKYSDDGTTIRLDTKKSKEAFIKLLNDSYLRSELTKQYYEARAKDNIQQ